MTESWDIYLHLCSYVFFLESQPFLYPVFFFLSLDLHVVSFLKQRLVYTEIIIKGWNIFKDTRWGFKCLEGTELPGGRWSRGCRTHRRRSPPQQGAQTASRSASLDAEQTKTHFCWQTGASCLSFNSSVLRLTFTRFLPVCWRYQGSAGSLAAVRKRGTNEHILHSNTFNLSDY